MIITKLLVPTILCLASGQLLSQTTAYLELLKAGDTVERNGSSYTIENNEFQTIREFAKIGPTNGTLVLYGGGDLSNGVLQEFENQIGSVRLFRLEPSQYGWDLRVRDFDGMDLSQITPPYRLTPNPRELYGWHFRNADNSATNTGDVNAPQHLRLFQFSPSLSGTGGFRPPSSLTEPTYPEPDPDDGRGALTITEMGLADLEPAQKARMNYLKFDACLTWPKTDEQMREEANAISPVFLDKEKESMYGCGLDWQQYELTAWVLPRWISGDFDDDDVIDEVAPVVHKTTGHRGIAICRAGTWISVLGQDNEAQQPLDAEYYSLTEYLDKVEFWEIRKSETGTDRLILGQIEKSEVGISWNTDRFSQGLLFHLVEP